MFTRIIVIQIKLRISVTGTDIKDCPGQVTATVGQVNFFMSCPTGQVCLSGTKLSQSDITYKATCLSTLKYTIS